MTKLYKVQVKEPLAHKGGERPIRWAGAEAAARKEKKALCEEHGLKANGADYEDVEVPTNKAGLLVWLNENFTK